MAHRDPAALRISRVLHAGFVFESEGTRILFDPIFENPFSRNCHAFPQVRFDLEEIRRQRFDAVFISHFHDDHCSLDSLDLLARQTPIHLYCVHAELFELIRALGFQDVRPLSLDRTVHMGPFEVTPRRALDAEIDSMFQVRAAGLNVLNVVDAWMDEEILELLVREGPWDLVLWPFQAMREVGVIAPTRASLDSERFPAEWIRQLRALNPRLIVPSSCQFIHEPWSWYNRSLFPFSYRQFQSLMREVLPTSEVVRMNPSVAIEVDRVSMRRARPLPWVQPVGDQDVDYDPNPHHPVPPTSEIARHFDALDAARAEFVFDYCRSVLPRKYSELGPPADPYFQRSRRWKLSVYDHAGTVFDFFYRIDEDALRPDDGQGPLAWKTEVPLAKLEAALRAGEALTSMYVRINDEVFSPEIEREIQDADVLDDPLVRCLFAEDACVYQRAQLQRLQRRARPART